MGQIVGKILDKETGQPIAARVQVLSSGGQFRHPKDAILKVGPGLPFFYANGEFTVHSGRGITQILAERGTEYVPARLSLDLPQRGTVTVDIPMERWSSLGKQGWHPGNTHIHYNEHEKRPDERLRLDPRVEDLRFTAISILKRWDLPYASNKYPLGVLTDFCSAHHHVECGEENRHNHHNGSMDEGYGHIMLLRIKQVVEPVSRGFLVDDTDPDYPPLCYACDETHRQGGIVIWCHNGRGMEAPIAAALGKLDGFNLFDPFWMDPEYDIWYAMLNCGLKLPASTGSDWFICSANRVYAYTGGEFSYEGWMKSLQKGNSFITNGPALHLKVNGQMPGETVRTEPGKKLRAEVRWESHYAIQRVELIRNGHPVASETFPEGKTEGRLEHEIEIPADGWIAARVASQVRDSFFQPIFAHTSPVYVAAGQQSDEQREAAAQFERSIKTSLERINQKARFQNDQQRREVVDLFKRGLDVYRKLSR